MAKSPKSKEPKAPSFQDLILRLERFWADQGCVILQPYDMEMGAATFHPATALRSLGPKPWRAAYVQPCRRPKDGRYGENPNRLQHYYQFQVILKPSPLDIQDLYLESLYAIGIDPKNHDIRFVEDDWESPTLGAWGLGWEVWLDGMEVSQFTYFQQVGGFDCDPVSGELTYGLERLAMYVQGVDRVFDLDFNGGEGKDKVTYGDVFLQAEQEYSRYNFEHADTAKLLEHFRDAEAECKALLAKGNGGERHLMALPAYDQAIKASHIFNLLDARGVISVTERQAYILRVRDLAKACCAAWLKTEAGGAAMLEVYRDERNAPPQERTLGAEAEAQVMDRPHVACDAFELPAHAEARREPRRLRDRGCGFARGALATRRRAFELRALSRLYRREPSAASLGGRGLLCRAAASTPSCASTTSWIPCRRMCWCRCSRPPARSQI